MDELLTMSVSTKPDNFASEGRKWVHRSLLALASVAVVFVAVGLWAARSNLSGALEHIPWQVIPEVIGLVSLGWLLRSLRWHYYVGQRKWPIPFTYSLLAFFSSFAFAVTPAKAGELVKSVLLRSRFDIPLADGAGVLLVERLGDLLAVMILAAGGFTLMRDGLAYFVAAILIVGGMTLVISCRPASVALLALFRRIHPKAAPLAEKIARLLDSGRALLQPAPLLTGIGIALVSWTCEGLAFHLLVRCFGLAIQPVTSCAIFGIATVVGAMSALPGGLGSFEVVAVILLTRLGLPASTAILPVLLFRFFSLWLANLVGFFFLMHWLAFVSKNKTVSPLATVML